MKHKMTILVEELVMLLYIGLIMLLLPEYILSIKIPIVVAVSLSAAILLSGLYEAAVCERVYNADKPSSIFLIIIVELIHNILVFGSFLLAYVVIRRYINYPVPTSTVLYSSVTSTFCHMSYGFVVPSVMDLIQRHLRRK